MYVAKTRHFPLNIIYAKSVMPNNASHALFVLNQAYNNICLLRQNTIQRFLIRLNLKTQPGPPASFSSLSKKSRLF